MDLFFFYLEQGNLFPFGVNTNFLLFFSFSCTIPRRPPRHGLPVDFFLFYLVPVILLSYSRVYSTQPGQQWRLQEQVKVMFEGFTSIVHSSFDSALSLFHLAYGSCNNNELFASNHSE